jgi:hypothetical protein
MPLAYQKARWSTRQHPLGFGVAGSGGGVGGGDCDGGRGWCGDRGGGGFGTQALPAWAEAVSGMGQAPPDKVPIPGIAAALRGIDSKLQQRISRRLLVRNRQHLDIA